MNSQKQDLINWINELLDALIPFVDNNSGLFHNYVDQPSTFLDGSGSMLISGKYPILIETLFLKKSLLRLDRLLSLCSNPSPRFFSSQLFQTPAAIYRLASILPDSLTKASSYISIADKIHDKTSSSLDQFGLFTNGVQVVSVLGFDDPGFVSVESLAFGLMMHAAKRDYLAGNTTTVKVN